MKRIPSFSITIHVIGDFINIYPTAYRPAYLVSTKSIKKLKTNLEDYIERVKEVLLRYYQW
jgi:hypothetical protein